MKRTLLAFLTLCLGYTANAQSALQHMEFEFGPSVLFYAKSNGAEFEPTWNLFAEARYNIQETPFDVGFQFGLGAFGRDWSRISGIEKNYHFKNFILVGDYSLRRGKNVSPYIGLGFGVSHQKIDIYYYYPRPDNVERAYSACLMPRIGIEFFRAIRLSASYKLMKSDYSNFECSLGFTYGDWKHRGGKQ